MSFTDRIVGLLQRPNDATSPEQVDAPWFLKYGSRILGIVGAFFAILFGLWNCASIIFFSVTCLISGILQMCAGFIVMALEAPFCFMCIEHVSTLAKKMDERPMWHRAALYCIISVPPVILCFGLASFFGCGLLFATGSLYGMMALGKKASAEDMRQAAVNSGFAGSNTTSDRAGIISNAQPFSFTGAVSTDSNV